ncbi:MAG: site-specific DNA-methyltransferase [Thermoleophilia bacterium]|nr:site-specific DNA-methyltransferase [Thermoleophilia bacterium]
MLDVGPKVPHVREIAGQRVVFGSAESPGLVPPSSVDLIVTSPPYWNLKDYGHPEQIGASTYDEYLNRLSTVWATCLESAKPEAVMVINVGNRRHAKRLYPIAFDIAGRMEGWQLWDILIWYIPNALPQPNHYIERLFDNKYEFLLVFVKDETLSYKFHKPRVPQKYLVADPRPHKKNARGRCLGNVIRIPAYRPPNVKELGYHVAAYPEELVALMIESFTDPGDVVLDPFLGSGTTLKVARWMDRHGIGIEINESFEELIERRINERWEVPDWRNLDILHSSTMTPGMAKPRKIHLLRSEDPATADDAQSRLFGAGG